MKATRYIIKSGDTLWGISRRHYGDPARWPELYAYNNQQSIVAATHHRIVNPNLIRAGQVLFLPPKHQHIARRSAPLGISGSTPNGAAATAQSNVGTPAQTAVSPQAAQNGASPSAAPGNGSISGHSNPAAEMIVNNFAFAYQLDNIPAMEIKGVGFTATVRPRGTVFLQSSSRVPLINYSNRGAEMQARQQTTTVLGQLISAGKLAWDRKDNKVTYECQMTLRANAQSPGAQLSAGVSSQGVPVLKATIVFPRMTGRVQDYVYAAGDFKIEVELKPEQDTRRLDPQPAPNAIPQSHSNSGWIWGAALVGTGITIVVATLVEDAVTAGAGVADDPASFALAGALIMRGVGAAGVVTPALVR